MRLSKTSLAVTVADKNIYQMTEMSVQNLLKFFENIELSQSQKLIGEQIIKEIKSRVGFLNNVGLDYLTLARSSRNSFRR